MLLSGIPRIQLSSKLTRNSDVVWKHRSDNHITNCASSEAHIWWINWHTMKIGRKDRGSRAVLIHPSDLANFVCINAVNATEGSHGLGVPIKGIQLLGNNNITWLGHDQKNGVILCLRYIILLIRPIRRFSLFWTFYIILFKNIEFGLNNMFVNHSPIHTDRFLPNMLPI